MSDPRALLQSLRDALAAPSPTQQAAIGPRLEALAQAVAALLAERERLRQDVEDAEHARDASKLQRMKVAGQLGTLHKALAAAAPGVAASDDPQNDALRRIEWLASHGGANPAAAEAAKAAEMDAPMPGRAVLEAVIAGSRKFTKAQLEFTIAEAMVLTGWQQTPLELMQQGEPWLAELILKNQSAAI
ncbi:hypothetical protein N790_14910 [Arenimonas malthae CC-JY-1]|uniref:Uncharacterized protein n=1 Tax=Arenimonas malthae CC-JY-1 TaxID=1384054 RepID=A0A091BEA0_9GAMM|nr:hypothetical protein [Arenimonas malthae]KFN50983.1 hypothetical protein N790_14910 [Arenimonas malthae CC-JY-1]